MDSHRIEVFDRADDDDIIFMIAHDLQLEFLPTQYRFFDENFVNRRNVQPMLHDLFEVVWPIGKISAAAAKRTRRSNNQRKVKPLLDPHRLAQIARIAAPWQIQSGAPHRLFEEIAILSFLDRSQLRADHLDAVAIENASF